MEGRMELGVFGELADGEVVTIHHDRDAVRSAVVPNWAPVLDFQLADVHGDACDALFVTSNRVPYGKVREIRGGLEAVVTSSSPDFDGVNGMWSIKYRPEDDFDSFLAVAFVSETKLMYLGGGELEDISEASGFDTEERAIVVGAVHMPGFLVQIHRRAVVVAHPIVPAESVGAPEATRWRAPLNTSIAAAGVIGNFVVIALSPINTLYLLGLVPGTYG
ncbi:hypothetical protein HK097_001204 [Rhizophlyctis rosea]|uniref:RSE1/DDB1/CPSF1 second beta-propeller domain-containing protein n=1 Tax=Rhizophlyctis rosea TaxID=64517 RepID=A0AAD5SNA1_9FUNG|nr:hypothetical protein HK097_001204 [Rhizophlyctis rosea]